MYGENSLEGGKLPNKENNYELGLELYLIGYYHLAGLKYSDEARISFSDLDYAEGASNDLKKLKHLYDYEVIEKENLLIVRKKPPTCLEDLKILTFDLLEKSNVLPETTQKLIAEGLDIALKHKPTNINILTILASRGVNLPSRMTQSLLEDVQTKFENEEKANFKSRQEIEKEAESLYKEVDKIMDYFVGIAQAPLEDKKIVSEKISQAKERQKLREKQEVI